MQDSFNRITTCLRVLSSPSPELTQCWLDQCRSSYAALLSEKQMRIQEEQQAKAAELLCQPDDLINFAHLKHRKGLSQVRKNPKLDKNGLPCVCCVSDLSRCDKPQIQPTRSTTFPAPRCVRDSSLGLAEYIVNPAARSSVVFIFWGPQVLG